MIVHTSDSRGKADHGWLKSAHSFSFANYYDPKRMGFGTLRVINDDEIFPGMGFGTHPHRDMEIITIPLEGALQHRDSMGNSSVIKKGEVQIMSAGTGITHSEFNASKDEMVKLLQIWVLPKKLGITPRYEQKLFPYHETKNKFMTIVSPDGQDGSVWINQDAYFSLVQLEKGSEITYSKKHDGNGVYVFIISGSSEIDGKVFKARDGVGIDEFQALKFHSKEGAEILVMEIPL